MAIIYYPDHIQKKRRHVVDVMANEETVLSAKGSKDITSSALSYRFSPLAPSWTAKTTSMKFSAAVNKTYAVSIETGRGIITGLNDSLWISAGGSSTAEKIVLAQGFYNGTELSSQVKAALEANPVFSGLSLTFTVTYNTTSDVFTITPSSGTIYYWNTYTQVNVRRNSSAGHVLGFTADQSGAALVSDTAVPSLGSKSLIVGDTGTDSNIVVTDAIDLSVDEAVTLESTTGAAVVEYFINYTTKEW